ncbi:unnamed protein product [Lactuca virosa]|uniref:Enhanced disease resistance 4-like N-terminal domain-containing protein n=1 Tax=Lactuca virosa TaxID=75947 RepID=A0AAU9MYK3_9ASTR|nr:unnamed protein product [Lactuca virosa]
MEEKGSSVRLVRCPKCENLLPELPEYSVYQCRGCGAVLRDTDEVGEILNNEKAHKSSHLLGSNKWKNPRNFAASGSPIHKAGGSTVVWGGAAVLVFPILPSSNRCLHRLLPPPPSLFNRCVWRLPPEDLWRLHLILATFLLHNSLSNCIWNQ